MPTAGMELTLLARLPQHLLDRAVKAGLDGTRLRQAAGFAESDLADPDARVSRAKLIALWREICAHVDDPLLGLKLGAAYRAQDLGLIGYIMAASDNLGVALECITRYGRILSDDVQFSLHPGGDTVALDVSAPIDLAVFGHPIVVRLTVVLSIIRDITESDILPVAVHLPLAPPPDPEPYLEFFRVPPHFNSKAAALVLRAGDLRRPIPSADIALSHYLKNYARSILETIPPEGSLAHRIARILMVRLPAGDPGIDAVAVTLGMNTRTVQRRLKQEGTTYRNVRDSFRHSTARQLLGNPGVPIKEIAFLLGYQELGAFYRAFRRWETVSPMDFRKKHAPGTSN